MPRPGTRGVLIGRISAGKIALPARRGESAHLRCSSPYGPRAPENTTRAVPGCVFGASGTPCVRSCGDRLGVCWPIFEDLHGLRSGPLTDQRGVYAEGCARLEVAPKGRLSVIEARRPRHNKACWSIRCVPSLPRQAGAPTAAHPIGIPLLTNEGCGLPACCRAVIPNAVFLP